MPQMGNPLGLPFARNQAIPWGNGFGGMMGVGQFVQRANRSFHNTAMQAMHSQDPYKRMAHPSPNQLGIPAWFAGGAFANNAAVNHAAQRGGKRQKNAAQQHRDWQMQQAMQAWNDPVAQKRRQNMNMMNNQMIWDAINKQNQLQGQGLKMDLPGGVF